MFTGNTAIALQPTTPLPWICLDIETGPAPSAAVERALATWKPPSNIKDAAKIEERRQEAAAKIRDKSALLDAAPILCVAIQASTAVIFNGMPGDSPPIQGFQAVDCQEERGLLVALRDWLNTLTSSETILVGHNLRGFDLPKLRAAYVRRRLRLPAILTPRIGEEGVRTADTMALFKAFSTEHRDDFFVSLETVADGLGIERPKQVICGADVPELFQAERFAEILTYCAVDVVTTARAYALMSGSAADLL